MRKKLKFFVAFSIASIAIIVAFAIWPKKPLLFSYDFSRVFYASGGELLRITLTNDDKYRVYTNLSDISPLLKDSVLLYEDRYFYYHFGINPISVLRAFYTTYISKKSYMGASTISMQLARKLYDLDSSNVKGKLAQMFYALKLELLYSKDEILEAYLNLIPYGYNIEGIGAASLLYFAKPAVDLDIISSLNLITIPQNPNQRIRATEKNRIVRQGIYKQMLEKYPEHKGMEALIDIDLAKEKRNYFIAPHFTDYLTQEHPYRRNFKTTLDFKKQLLLENIMQSYIKRVSHLGINNAAALLVNWQNMEVNAYIGSADFFADNISGQVNAVTAKRSPGSSYKPFIYALALEEGLIHPFTLLKDSPLRYQNYAPDNFDKKFLGPIIAKDALTYSRNVPAVSLLLELKKRSFYSFLQEAEISDLRSEEYYGSALALGAFEVSMQESARLYAMLRNYGKLQNLKFLQDDHEVQTPILSSEAAFLTLDMLKDTPRPKYHYELGGKVFKNYDAYWKTGTSYGFKDAITSGIFGPYVLIIWVGNFDGMGNNAFVGRTAAAPLFFEIADSLFWQEENFSDYELTPYAYNLAKVEVCETTGDLPGIYCPLKTESWFIPGVSPIKTSNIYRPVFLDKKTGLRACNNDPQTTYKEIYEFWDSDLLELFEKAGIYKTKPPAFMPECSLLELSKAGKAPQIFLPANDITHVITANEKDIPLKAIIDSDVKQLFWFAGSEFLGTSKNNEIIYWHNPLSGSYKLRAIDELGRSATREVSVINDVYEEGLNPLSSS